MDQADRSDIYFDGVTAAAWPVACHVAGPSLQIDRGASGNLVWFFSEIFLCGPPSPDAPLTLGQSNSEERLIIRNPSVIEEIVAASSQLQKALAKFTPWRWPRWLAGLGAAAAGVATVFLFLRVLPAILAPFVPYGWEAALGERVQISMPYYFSYCRSADAEAILTRLADRLSATTGWKQKIAVHLVNDPTPNAFAIPGGHIYILSGLLQSARSGDEVAGVFAHEVGHVVRRHTMQQILRELGLSTVFTLVTGGATGDVNSAVTSYGGRLYSLSYSRDAERDADEFAIAALQKAGLRGDGLKRFFEFIAEQKFGGRSPQWLSTHPATLDRIERFKDIGNAGAPAFTDEEWKTLRAACSRQQRPPQLKLQAPDSK